MSGTKALVQQRVGEFFIQLSSRKEEVKRRCRTVLQSRAERLLQDSPLYCLPPRHVHHTLASVRDWSHVGLGPTRPGTLSPEAVGTPAPVSPYVLTGWRGDETRNWANVGTLSLLNWIPTTGNARRKLRAFLMAIPIALIVMSMSACQGSSGPAGEQGPPGPVGPAGPTGEAATLDKDEPQLVLQQLESAEARITADGPASGQQLMQGQTEASAPPEWMPEDYTYYFVREAIRRYESDGLDSTAAYYNTKESMDGQWYVFMSDEDGTVIAHANPALVGQLASDITGPNNYRCRKG